MQRIPDKSIDCIICDLPYGTTACSWDKVIPFDKLWEQYERVIKDDGAIVLFGQEPFSSALRTSNLKRYKYDWIWVKENAPNIFQRFYQPGKITENISVFSKSAATYTTKRNMVYNPQMTEGKPYAKKASIKNAGTIYGKSTYSPEVKNDGTRLPNNILVFKKDKDKMHPTQKPVGLMEYLIKTYTSEGDTVLDNCMGSGTTAIACINTHRNFIGFELNKEYYEMSIKRIWTRIQQLKSEL